MEPYLTLNSERVIRDWYNTTNWTPPKSKTIHNTESTTVQESLLLQVQLSCHETITCKDKK